MKVHIGAYLNWIGPYQIAEKLLFWMDKYQDDRVHNFGIWLSGGDGEGTWLMKLCEWVHQKRKRQVDIHIDKFDTWGMDHTLALLVLPMLKQLKATKHGIPCSISQLSQISTNSSQGCFDFYVNGDDDSFSAACQTWDSIMDEMIFAFEHYAADEEPDFWMTRPDIDWEDTSYDNNTTSRMGCKSPGEYDMDAATKHYDRVQKGLNLFASHYGSLWD